MKHSTQKTPGLLIPIVSPHTWHTVTLDFMEGFAPALDTQHTYCFVIVDKFTKYTILEGVDETVTAEQTAKFFVKRVVAEHGVPSIILSDRGLQFTAKLWDATLSLLGGKATLTAAHHL